MTKIQDGIAFEQFLQELIDGGYLEQPALGITALVKDKGRHQLTPKQDYVFQTKVIDEFVQEECPFCFTNLEWNEMVFVRENGMCPYCVNKLEKD